MILMIYIWYISMINSISQSKWWSKNPLKRQVELCPNVRPKQCPRGFRKQYFPFRRKLNLPSIIRMIPEFVRSNRVEKRRPQAMSDYISNTFSFFSCLNSSCAQHGSAILIRSRHRLGGWSFKCDVFEQSWRIKPSGANREEMSGADCGGRELSGVSEESSF